MLKRLFIACAAVCLALAAVPLSAKQLKIATTIDFLDYAFEYKGAEDYYPVEEYEKVIADLAKNGFNKVYLRVNVCGLTHYPSTVSAIYGQDGAFHWTIEKPALRLVETYKHYDVCKETIRLCRKYGLECWAWESLFDDAGVRYSRGETDDKYAKAYERLDGWSLLDPFYLENPDALAERDPYKLPNIMDREAVNAAAARLPIARIVLANDPERSLGPSKLTKDQLAIYVSDDNRTFVPYKGDFDFKNTVVEGTGRAVLDISGLNITQKYIKLGRKNYDPKDKTFRLVLSRAVGQGLVYNTDGESIVTTWCWEAGPLDRTSLSFRPMSGGPAAWDYEDRCVGCCRGLATSNITERYYYGVAEFTVPKAMKHKVDRFIELAKYDFDGFIFNTRCHSAMPDRAIEYGYNPEVLQAFRKRYGHAYRGTDADIKGVFQIRAESIAKFFKNCKEKSGGRPIYLSGPVPLELKERKDYNKCFGPLPWLYKQYFKDGSIDGIIMIGTNFANGDSYADYFTKDITGGKDIKIGIFREMMNCPKGYDFYKDMQELRASDLDEVELYETLMFQFYPDLMQVVNGTAKPGWKTVYKRK